MIIVALSALGLYVLLHILTARAVSNHDGSCYVDDYHGR